MTRPLTDRQHLRLELVKVTAPQCSPACLEKLVMEREAFVLAADDGEAPMLASPFGPLQEVSELGAPEGERHFRDADGRLVIVREKP
jgi:hypothetical protein